MKAPVTLIAAVAAAGLAGCVVSIAEGPAVGGEVAVASVDTPEFDASAPTQDFAYTETTRIGAANDLASTDVAALTAALSATPGPSGFEQFAFAGLPNADVSMADAEARAQVAQAAAATTSLDTSMTQFWAEASAAALAATEDDAAKAVESRTDKPGPGQ